MFPSSFKSSRYAPLLWVFLISLATLLVFQIEKLTLFLPLLYFVFAAVFVWKHKEIQQRKNLIGWAVVYILVGILDGAFLTFFWRSVVLLLLPVLFGLWQRSRLTGKGEIAAVGSLFTAPMVLLWLGSLPLEEVVAVVAFLAFGSLAGFFGFWLVTAGRARLLPLAAFMGSAIAGIAIGIPNVMAYTSTNALHAHTPLTQSTFVNAAGTPFSMEKLKGEVVVLDFWFTGCSVCFEKFPEFEALANKHQKEQVVFATVNVPLPEQAATKFQNLDLLRKYPFQKWVLQSGTTDNIRPYINGYPFFMVFDKEGKLRSNGGLFRGRQYLVNNIEDLLAKLEKE